MNLKYYLKEKFQRLGLLENPIYRAYSSARIKSYNEKLIKKQHPLLVQYGPEILRILFESNDFKDIPIWLEYGTLLGAVRSNDFISHDIDMDFGMYVADFTESFQKKLVEAGFVKNHQYYFMDLNQHTEELSEVSFHYKELNIDFFLSKPLNETQRTWYSYYIVDRVTKRCGVVKSTSDNAYPLQDIMLHGVKCKTPSNPNKHLIGAYGKNYMIPDPNWNAKDDLGFREWLDVKDYCGRVVLFK